MVSGVKEASRFHGEFTLAFIGFHVHMPPTDCSLISR